MDPARSEIRGMYGTSMRENRDIPPLALNLPRFDGDLKTGIKLPERDQSRDYEEV
jgi:hypothetical protein